ncbi:MAG: glycoside hydrolase family 2 TIM barrel-domain containing protein [Christensenellales bacterium]
MPVETLRRDLLTMKRNNINAVRTCHYPNSSALYALCDELGLYVIDETNMETHGTWETIERGKRDIDYALPGNRMEWAPMMLDRVNSMFSATKTTPASSSGAAATESFGGDVIYEMSRLFRRLDDTRLVHYEGVFHDRRHNDTSDMESQMYTPVVGIRKYLAEHRERPFIMCEIYPCHGQFLRRDERLHRICLRRAALSGRICVGLYRPVHPHQRPLRQ